PIVIYSRKVLNGLLLDRAVVAGCTAICSRVTEVKTGGARGRLSAGGGNPGAGLVVPAAGGRQQTLAGDDAPGAARPGMDPGYFVPTEEDIIKVKFLKQFEGYIWSFPRADHLSVGICAKLGQTTSQKLRQHLDDFIAEEKITMAGAQLYSHVLPSPQAHTIRG